MPSLTACRIALAAAGLLGAIVLAGCGNKGPLVPPPPAASKPAPVKPAPAASSSASALPSG